MGRYIKSSFDLKTRVTECYVWPWEDDDIQDRVDLCAMNLEGGIVHLMPGKHTFNEQFTVWPNVILNQCKPQTPML